MDLQTVWRVLHLNRIICAILLICLAGCALQPADYADSVFCVRSQRDLQVWGTAFVVGRRGDSAVMATAAHVIALGGVEALSVRDRPIELLAILPDLDVAVFAVELPEWVAFEPLALAEPRKGQAVTVLGYPYWYTGKTVPYRSTGAIVSVYPDFCDYSARASPGNSGSPVLDGRGRMVGMVTLAGGFEGARSAGPSAGAIRQVLRRCESD